jgi:hypothetical protein
VVVVVEVGGWPVQVVPLTEKLVGRGLLPV